MGQTTKLSRKELYDLVWAEPMSRLAKRYAISDVGMAKICRKHDIPCPPRGYWAKKQFGKAPRQTPLPKPDHDTSIAMLDASQRVRPESHLPPELSQVIATAESNEARIQVADSLRGSHQLVSLANEQFQNATKADDGLLSLPEGSALNIYVSKANVRRALLIMDALLKALEQRGLVVAMGPHVEMLEARVGFGISEGRQAVREEPEQHDLTGQYRFGHSRFNTKWIPSGKLTLSIDDGGAYWANGARHTWRDSPKQPLENRLNSFVQGLLAFVAQKKAHQLILLCAPSGSV